MTATTSFAGPIFHGLRQTFAAALGAACLLLAGCGGSADAPPPPEGSPPQAVAPAITQQPADLTVTAGQPASFTVAATGTAPLAYQWQRNGVAIAGATTTTYTLAATVLADSGAVFRAVVTNVAGSATSNNATLTVVAAAPVLTITQQPANTTVVAGTSATFSVAATCSSGTLLVQWQRSSGSGAALTFADIAGATALSYTFSTVIGDSAVQFRAVLSCSGQSTTPSNAATLTVTPPGGVTLSLLPLVGLRDQAEIPAITGIDQDPSGSFTFITGNRIKRLSADLGTVTPVAGSNGSGSTDGAAAAALFNQPFALTQDGAGIVYIADSGNSTIRRIAVDGTVNTLAGLAGASGTTDGTGAAARFNSPTGIAIGPDGDLYVAERNSHLIRRVTTAGVVTTYAGSTVGYLDGAPLTAKFNNPFGVAVAANGDVLVADANNNRIRRIVRNGNVAGPVQTLAGNGTATPASPDGIGAAAVIARPLGIVVRGNVLTLRDDFGLLRQIDLTTAAVTTLTGSRSLGAGYADGTPTTAQIRDSSIGVTGAANGGFVLGDADGLRLVSAAGAVRTIAHDGNASTTALGVGVLAQLPFVVGVNRRVDLAVDSAGNIVVVDENSATVRRIDPAGAMTFAAGLVGGRSGPIDGTGSEAQFFDLWDVITDNSGVTYVSDGGSSVHRIDANGATTLFAGSANFPSGLGYVDGNRTAARFNFITGLAFGAGGNLFVADRGNNVIRRIDAAGNVTTYAGVAGQSAFVDGPIATARFQSPNDIVLGPDGSLYVLDKPNNILGSIRRIAADGSSVSTIVGSGAQVRMFTIDPAGTIYYTDDLTTQELGGLWMLPAGATVPTRLIQYGFNSGVVLGSNPRISGVDSIVVLGPKRILLASGGQLLVATLP